MSMNMDNYTFTGSYNSDIIGAPHMQGWYFPAQCSDDAECGLKGRCLKNPHENQGYCCCYQDPVNGYWAQGTRCKQCAAGYTGPNCNVKGNDFYNNFPSPAGYPRPVTCNQPEPKASNEYENQEACSGHCGTLKSKWMRH